MLKALLSFGASCGMCERHNVTITARSSRKVQNFLKPAELKRLDAALLDLIAEQPERIIGFSAIRLLLHTGMRKGEVLTLDWSMVDLENRVIHLAIDKASGENVGRDVMLTDAAAEVLRSLPKLKRGQWVFFGQRRDGHLVDLEYFWRTALARAGIRRVRIHDLRHSFAWRWRQAAAHVWRRCAGCAGRCRLPARPRALRMTHMRQAREASTQCRERWS